MRFLDWDVLLFPHGSHVPLREFRTACFASQDTRTLTTTPLLTCFVPALPASTAFQVSVHSWTKPTAILGSENLGYVPGTQYRWRVKIVIDGVAVGCEQFAEDATWPKQLEFSLATDVEGKHLPLAFPRFHRSMMSQTHWNASDDLGRIKIQLSAGYDVHVEGRSQFVKILDHVVFSFQPAPLDVLERSKISWPNPELTIVNNPLQGPEARRVSLGAGLSHVDDSSSSRSTSAYSFVPPAAYPPLDTTVHFPSPVTQGVQTPQMHLRLPSDQLQKIIDALSPAKTPAAVSSPPRLLAWEPIDIL
ncbi:hypothetical protein LTR53_017538 [Teratosphaeriaceae sp. CCFEE 6253]|nr:hypothetical protein LTR53_017538 [Teratosphaeriaceae sp. CCFEE 6253]